MNFDTFLSTFSNAIFSKIPSNCTPCVQTLTKNNGTIHHAIALTTENCAEAPLIYIDSYYEDYCNGISLQKLIENFMDEYEHCMSFKDSFPNIPRNLEDMKTYIFVKAIHYERNLSWIESVPHRRILDLAMIYEFVFPHAMDGYGFGKITYPIMNELHLTEETLYELAWNNMHTQNPPRSISVRQYIDSDFEKDFTKTAMHILTNQNKMHGAAYIFDTKLLQSISNYLESDLCILPSSIHEIIILPWNEVERKDELNSMIQEINTLAVDIEEQLSDHMYIFHKDNGELTM